MARRLVRAGGPIPPGAVYIGRGSPVGNPYVIGRDGTRAEVIVKYEAWFARQLRKPGFADRVLAYVGSWGLACWCPPRPCHGDVLMRWLDSIEGRSATT